MSNGRPDRLVFLQNMTGCALIMFDKYILELACMKKKIITK